MNSTLIVIPVNSRLAGLEICSIFLLISVILYEKLFKKMGLDSWKAFIPFYRIVTMYYLIGIGWLAWIQFIMMAVGWVLAMGLVQGDIGGILSYIVLMSRCLINAIVCIRLSLVFGKGWLFSMGLMFINPVFIAILAFDSSEFRHYKTEA